MRMQARHGFVCCVCGAGYDLLRKLILFRLLEVILTPTQCKNLLSSISVRPTKHRKKIKKLHVLGQ